MERHNELCTQGMRPNRLAQLVSYILLGYAAEDQGQPIPFCALTWEGELSSPKDVHLFLKPDWESIIPTELVDYFTELLDYWRLLLRATPAALLAFASELSVGPLRTIEAVPQSKELPTTVSRMIAKMALQFPPELARIS